ncbi:peroxidase family protein [Brevundimonas lenta]|uniref:Ca2+-binding RTX toxin-like protein n=1 Tax=Brevundimonas lenta TaxID=424796 RepID=A0A7W6NPP7_9CAUL|nr:peroxidase family protein [Brevundimonas lenta]MBB4083625.1 Ca2+-binding RTX toxin-like protein [Brevundimonas lenta]
MVTYIRSDLDFILAQIKIAEAHANGQPLYGPGGLIPAYNLSWGLRTVDGTYNNLLNPEHGASDNPFPTLLGTQYRTIMVDPDGPGPTPSVPVSYVPGVDNDGPGTAGPGDVFDPYVRTISNLIVDQTLANPSAILTALQRAGVVAPADEMSTLGVITAAYEAIEAEFLAVSQSRVAYFNLATTAAANPGDAAAQAAAAAALVTLNNATAALDAVRGPLDALLATNGIVMEGDNVQITNTAPDEGLSAPFNSWFTLFGQFFDHGLDLVAKGGQGTVFIPLMPDDPLYVPGGTTNFMVLTRASRDANGNAINTTTPFVDQNQTYSSHASHQVFLRDYEFNGAGDPVNTGKLIEGTNGGMATWADMKAQARTLLGINLTDQDVGDVPLLATDEYGNFTPGPNGFPQVVFADPANPTVFILVEGNPAANGGLGISLSDGPGNSVAVRTGHAFLADIAHSAVPDGLQDGDIEIGLGNGDGSATDGFYDNELLDAHFMAGDGRANENIGLTAVHHVFHSEHNRLVDHTKAVALADAQAILAGGGTQAQAVAFLNEWLLTDVTTVPASVAGLVWDGERLFQAAKFGTEMQYQHLVFEEFARKIQPNINVFLVPDGYDVTIDPDIVAEFAHVVYRFGHSMLTETIDRFDPTMTPDQISLIEGFLNPLEFQNNGGTTTVDANIAAGAIIRGMTRQEGNQIDEFVTSALRNNLLGLPLDLATINLARGRDTGVPSLNEARRQFYEAAQQNTLMKPYESWVDFASHLKNEASIINFIAAYGDHALITGQSTIDGKRDAALTIITGTSVGGLTVPADRLAFLNASGAYAGAVPGSLGGLENVDLWIGGLAEEIMPFGGMLGSTFNFVFEIQMEKLQSGDRFYYLQRLDGLHLFSEMEGNSFAAMIMRNTDATHLPSDVFSTPGLILEINQAAQFNDLDGDGLLESTDPTGSGLLTQLVIRDNPGTAGADSNYLRYTGFDHIVLGGTNNADIMISGGGDDTMHGDAGNDRMEGGFGNDIINGGAGDDIISDSGGDDNVKGGDGNDVVQAGPGLDLVLGGAGQDFVVLGTDMGSEVFGGTGNDFILGNRNAERLLGNEGNDWLETGTFDGAPGDNFDEIFAHDGIRGHDVFIGDGGFDEFIGEGGDDIMVGSPGRGKMAGMSGFDWATYKNNTTGVFADLSVGIVFDEAPTLPQNAALDEYESMEGLSGTAFNDILLGSNDDAAAMVSLANGGASGFYGSQLDAAGIARITGLQAMLGAGVTSWNGGDIIMGGDGNDLITGQAGDDFIDGDTWLNVRIAVHAAIGPDGGTGAILEYADSMNQLMTRMFNGTLNPGQLNIARDIMTANGAGDVDIAVFSGNFADYTITNLGGGRFQLVDNVGTDGTDVIRNIEIMRFADGDVAVNSPATGVPVINDQTPTETQQLTANTAGIADANGLGAFSYQWQLSTNGGTTWTNIGGANGVNYTPAQAQVGGLLRVAVSFTDGVGNAEQVFSVPTGVVGDFWNAIPILANTFNGTAGDDIANGTSGLLGLGANDTLNGNAGDDQLNGAGGTDTLNGGAGNDRLDGGAGGADVAVWAGAVGAFGFGLNGTGQLTVTDLIGTEGVDTLTTVENLRFNAVTYALVNGTNAAGTSNGGANADIVLGHGGVDTVNGAGGNDVLVGGAGNDTALGGAGNDQILWGVGDGRDFIDGQGNTDTVRIRGDATAEVYRIYSRTAALAAGITGLNANTEIVITRNGTNNASIIAELDNIEEITITGRGGGDTFIPIGTFAGTSLATSTITIDGSDGNDTVDITELSSAHRIVFRQNGGTDTVVGTLRPDDVVEAFGPEAPVLTENAGSDESMDGTTGEASYAGGAGNDTLSFETSTAGKHVSLNGNYARNADGSNQASLTSIENVVGSAFADTLVGSAVANVMFGGEGSDTLIGLGGDDFLWGGAGLANTMQGGLGNDIYYVEANDTVLELAGEGTDSVLTTRGSWTLRANVENLAFVGAGDFIGVGNDLANAMEGGVGNDVLSGRGGIDALIGGGGIDTVSYASAVGGVSVNLNGSIASNDGDGASDTLSGFENVTGSALNDTLIGSLGANVLSGGTGADYLIGLDGDDTLHGGSGAANTLQGGSGNDHYVLSAAGDSIVEAAGGGLDWVDTLSSLHTLAANVENVTYTGVGNFTGTGNADANVITGGIGNDTLSGRGGNDTLNGGGGNDLAQLQGLAGQYMVTAVAGGYLVTDTVGGRDGADTLLAVERVRYANGTIVTLESLVAAPTVAGKSAADAQVLPAAPKEVVVSPLVQPAADKAVVNVPQVLPSLDDDAFVLPVQDEAFVLPALQDRYDMPSFRSWHDFNDFGADAFSHRFERVLPQIHDFGSISDDPWFVTHNDWLA